MPHKQEIIDVVESLLDKPEEFLVSVDISADQSITVVLDAMQGIDIDRCVAVSRGIEGRFDREEDDYSLTVASQGLTDPLVVPEQFLKNMGNPVTLVTRKGERYDAFLSGFEAEPTPTVKVEVPVYKPLVKGRAPKEIKRDTLTFPLEDIKSVCYRLDF